MNRCKQQLRAFRRSQVAARRIKASSFGFQVAAKSKKCNLLQTVTVNKFLVRASDISLGSSSQENIVASKSLRILMRPKQSSDTEYLWLKISLSFLRVRFCSLCMTTPHHRRSGSRRHGLGKSWLTFVKMSKKKTQRRVFGTPVPATCCACLFMEFATQLCRFLKRFRQHWRAAWVRRV